MNNRKELYIVYCIDTEGPLNEPLSATFDRLEQIFRLKLKVSKANLEKLQRQELDVPHKADIARVISPHLLAYNNSWDKVDSMLDKIMTKSYRDKYIDSEGKGIVYNWHCIDHVGFSSNKRRRDIGFGNIFNHYQEKIDEHDAIDQIHWHFHPVSYAKEAHMAATSYDNSMALLHEIITRRTIDNNWFPVVNRAGFHAVRHDSSMFLEQWIPFDYSNQAQYEDDSATQLDCVDGRFGDWRRAPKTWSPYHPSHSDYQTPGDMNRYTTKCLNIGTRVRLLTDAEIKKAFEQTSNNGKAILSFTNHDFRDMDVDIQDIYSRIFSIAKEYSDVNIVHCDAIEAMQRYCFDQDEVKTKAIEIKCELFHEVDSTKLIVTQLNGEVFGTQPYLALKTFDGVYHHDNFDELEYGKSWIYTFDWQNLLIRQIECLKVVANDKYGNTVIEICEV